MSPIRKKRIRFSLLQLLLVSGVLGALSFYWVHDRQNEFFAETQLIRNGFFVSNSITDNGEWGFAPAAEGPRIGVYNSFPERVAWHFRRVRAVSATLYGSGTIQDNSLQPLKMLRHVEYMNLGDYPLSDDGLDSIIHLHKLKHLYLFSPAITDIGLRKLSALTQLEYLGLGSPHLTDSALSDLLPKFVALRQLSLFQTGASGKTVNAIGTLSDLQNVTLANCDVHSEDLKGLLNLRELRELDLSGTLIDDSAGYWVSQMSSLECLNLDNTTIGEGFFKQVEKLSNLKELSIENTNIRYCTIKRFFDLPLLRKLHFDGTPIDDQRWLEIHRRFQQLRDKDEEEQ
jgi:hypothetical protein